MQSPQPRIEQGVDKARSPLQELTASLGTDDQRGLTTTQAEKHLKEYGRNEISKPPKPTLLMLFVLQLTSFIILLLIAAAGASVAVNATGPHYADPLSYTTGKAIFVIVLINAGIAAWTEHKAGGALDALSKMTQPTISVVRNGSEVNVDTVTIVPGDLVILGTGDVVPADMRLIAADDLKVSEMALTGEPDDVAKTAKLREGKASEPDKLTPVNMVFSGCNVTSGKGKGIVVDTGMTTRIGQIAQLIADKDGAGGLKYGCLPDTSANATPLQNKLESLGRRIGMQAIVVCIGVFIIGVVLDRKDPSNPDSDAWLYMILIAVTLAVAAIPEGIPLCVTISLSLGCKDMVKKDVLVRKLAAVETLGSASVICSDKTGTLTEGKMTMVNMWSAGNAYDITGKGFDPNDGGINYGGEDAGNNLGVRSTLFAAMLCSSTTLHKVSDPKTGEEKWEPKGNSSEAPIVVAFMKAGFTEESAADYKRVVDIPFSSSRKMMLTITDVSGRNKLCVGGMPLPSTSQFLTVCKGAPNYILDICTSALSADGSSKEMTDCYKQRVLDIVDEYSCRALRVLAIATRTMETLPFDLDDDDVSVDEKFKMCSQGLTLMGLVASIDPDRDGVKESVSSARGAGIRVVMITGDYLLTAKAIAKNVRILEKGDNESIAAVDCKVLRPNDSYLPDDKFDAYTKHVRVFARAKPEDKLEIVKSLQRQGFVTAMTGDGVNDAPALNQADIGVAMGIQGTDVAKGAADMVLRDDNFCSIVAAVEKGRAIYAGIQKFVAFIMSVHIAEVMQIFVCIVAGIPVMRTPVQILFLILVTDLPPSIALGMEPVDKSILKQRPRPKSEPVVLDWMWISMVLNGAVLYIVVIAVYLCALMKYCDGFILQDDISMLPDSNEKLADARTVAFVSLVFCENVRSYISRSFDQPIWHCLFGNVEMHKAIFMAQVALWAAVLIPGFSETILELRGLHIGGWGYFVALGGPLGTIILCELCKLVTGVQMRSYQRRLAEAPERVQSKEIPQVLGKANDATQGLLQKDLAQAPATDVDLKTFIGQFSDDVCCGIEWVLADSGRLECRDYYNPSWRVEGVKQQGLENLFTTKSAQYTFAPGEGLVGKTFLNQKQLFVEDLQELGVGNMEKVVAATQSAAFLRANLAKHYGIHSAIFVPTTNGVLEAGSTKKLNSEAEMLKTALLPDGVPGAGLPPRALKEPATCGHGIARALQGQFFSPPPTCGVMGDCLPPFFLNASVRKET
jgi:potassium/sodium efflux P-type ATPase